MSFLANMFASVQQFLVFVIFLLSIATCTTSCTTVQDCSKFSSYKRCRCIKKNGDVQRYKKCHQAASEKVKEGMRKDCWRRCYDDCEKCEEI